MALASHIGIGFIFNQPKLAKSSIYFKLYVNRLITYMLDRVSSRRDSQITISFITRLLLRPSYF